MIKGKEARLTTLEFGSVCIDCHALCHRNAVTKGEPNEKRNTVYDPVDIEHEEVLAGINILQNQQETPNMNSTKT